jgi:hypothetical protein
VIKLVLLNDAGDAVASFATDWDAKSIIAGETTVLTAGADFPGTAAGTYRLAVGFYMSADGEHPAYRLDNNGRTQNGHYVIGELVVR